MSVGNIWKIVFLFYCFIGRNTRTRMHAACGKVWMDGYMRETGWWMAAFCFIVLLDVK